jgi:NAD(P)-dependent dehydrogenase (short-subunit alcohol dehydrogenase family)
MKPQDVRAVVVGGASGMARATAVSLRSLDAAVAILDRHSSAGAQVAADIDASFHPCDVTDEASVERGLQDAIGALGGLNVAINTPGGSVSKRIISKTGPLPLNEFRNVIELNLVATFNLNRLQAWHMSQEEPNETGERGVIINTSSIAAFEGQIGQVAYSAAKGGIASMTLTMARDLGGLGIRVMAIAPSLFATGLSEGITPEMEALLTKDAAFPKRMGFPEEFARLAVAIIETPMLNGSTIRLDGGQHFSPK